jgi:hypothetical protein
MNANELADELENTYPFVGVMEIAATMLRQQQAEIEALKKSCLDEIFKRVYAERSVEVVSELYTHPVKELTDEEIREIWEIVSLKWWDWENSFDVTGFARAILRKAQENG